MGSSLYLAWTLTALALGAGPARADYPNCISGTPTADAVSAWRAQAVAALNGNNSFQASLNPVAATITKCFPTQVPSCLVRTYAYASRYDLADYNSDKTLDQTPQKRPPDELLAPNAQGLQYTIPTNIEAIAKSKGWVSARYKSRHSGGFDGGTASLLMIYVPGDKVSPPVTFDRWLNFALPADVAPDTMNPVPQKQFPSAQDYANEYTSNSYYPRTFTMISLDRATATSPSRVYFQKFNRSGGNNGIFTPEEVPDVAGCSSCHPNGMRAISPLGYHVRAGEAQLPPDIWSSVLAINTAMTDDDAGKLTDWRMGTKTIYTQVPVTPAVPVTAIANPVATNPAPIASANSTYPLCPAGVTANGGWGWVATQSLCQQSSTTQHQFSQSHGCSCSTTPPLVPAPVVVVTPSTGGTYPACPSWVTVNNGWGWVTDQGSCAQSATTSAQFAQSSGCTCNGGAQAPATTTVTSTIELPLLRPAGNWPIVGALKPMNKISRTQAFIMGGTLPDGTTAAGCYKNRSTVYVVDIFNRPPGQNNIYKLSTPPNINWVKVRNAMNCELCHNNRNRYAISRQTDSAQIDFKILVDQSMPQGSHQDPMEQGSPTATVIDNLTGDERIALANCLKAELDLEDPLVNNWLTTPVCQ